MPGTQPGGSVYTPTDGWLGALLGFAVGEGGRLVVGGRDSDSGGRSVHLRPQGSAQSAAAVVAALDATSLRSAGVSSGASGTSQRTLALVLVLVAGIGLAVVAIREWRGGAGGRSVAEVWQQVRARRPGAPGSGP